MGIKRTIWCSLLVVTLLSVITILYSFQDIIRRTAVNRLKYDELLNDRPITKEGSREGKRLVTCVNSKGHILATINKTLDETFAGLNCSCILSNSIPPEVCSVLYRPWFFNSSLAKQYRDSLNKATRNNRGFILTQNKNLSSIKNELMLKVNAFLPKVSPLNDKLFNKCSVVGSSGILRNSFCGDEIDKADFVFRCNSPPISNFKADAGQKVNLTTINPRGVIGDRYKGFRQNSDKERFLQDMKDFQNGNLWVPSHAAISLKRGYDVMLLLNNTNIDVTIGNYQHYTSVKSFWEKKFKSKPTTGLYLLSIALSVCKETHAFGFWPFYEGNNGTKIKYHYYDDVYRNYMVSGHNFVAELKTLIELHRKGAIKLHLDKCSSKS